MKSLRNAEVQIKNVQRQSAEEKEAEERDRRKQQVLDMLAQEAGLDSSSQLLNSSSAPVITAASGKRIFATSIDPDDILNATTTAAVATSIKLDFKGAGSKRIASMVDAEEEREKLTRPVVPLGFTEEERRQAAKIYEDQERVEHNAMSIVKKQAHALTASITATNKRDRSLDRERDRERERSRERKRTRDRSRSRDRGTKSTTTSTTGAAASSFNLNQEESHKLKQKQLVDLIPTEKAPLYAYKIDWDTVHKYKVSLD